MLGSKETKYIDAFFLRGRHQNPDICCKSQPWYELPINTIRNNYSGIMLFPQTKKRYQYDFNDISGLHMCFWKWRNFCREAWQKTFFIGIDKDKDLDDKYCQKTYQV